MLNCVLLEGRLIKQVEIRSVKVGEKEKHVATFSLAVTGSNKLSCFFECIAWDKLAENVTKFTNKGDLISVRGRLNQRKVKTKDGKEFEKVELILDEINFLTTKKEKEDSKTKKDDEILEDNTLPF